MNITTITEAQTWDQALLALPNPHVLQSWAWGEFKARHGWQPTRVLFQEEGRTVAAASMLYRQQPPLPVTVCYVPQGPSLDWTDGPLVGRVLAELESLARGQGATFLKVDPDVVYAGEAPGVTSPATFAPWPTCAGQTARLLENRGWCFSDDQIQFRNTVLLDLFPAEDELLAAMKQKTRYNIRLAGRRGVVVRDASAGPELARELDTFYALYQETAERDGFLIRQAGYYHDAWGSFVEQGLAHLLLAEVEGGTVAGLILFTFGPTAWYMYGASSNRHRKHMPNYLLQWEAIRRAKAAGCTLYDLWGAPDDLDESDPMWGVVRFKLGLGGQIVRGLGAWDYPVRRAVYRLYRAAMPRYLAWQRGRQQ